MVCSLLVTEVMLGRGEKTVGHHQIDRIAGIRGQTGEALGNSSALRQLPLLN